MKALLSSLFLLLAAITTTAQAQTTVWTTPDSTIIIPHSRPVIIPHPHPHPRPQPAVAVEAVDVNIWVNDQVATTEIAIRLRNDGDAQQDAEVLVPVPDGAAIRSFHVEGLGSEPTARLLPRDEARRIYNQIVSSMKDPGLLEFAGYNHLRSSVFPVPAHGTQACRLTYETLLPADGARIDYSLPRTQSLASTGVNWSFNLDITSTRPISTVYSPSHDLVSERIDPKHIRVKVPAAAANKPGSLMVSILREAEQGLSATFLAYPDPAIADGKGGYFLLLAGLPADAPQDRIVKREVTIVIDRSGSMRGQKMDQAREAARQVLEGLKNGEAFNIIDYSDSIAGFAAAPVVKNDETMAAARKYLDGITANGGTNIHDAIVEALRPAPTEGTLPMVLFLTDGLPTVGQTSEVAIREAAEKANAHKRRIFTFGVGFDVNAPLLSTIARTSRATTTFVLPEEDVEVKVGQVFRRLSGPVLANPVLTASGPGMLTMVPVRELQPAALADLFEGDQLILLGQYIMEGATKFTLRGDYFGQPREFEFTFDSSGATTRNSHVPRLWATRKIASLVDAIRQAGADSGIPGNPNPSNDPRLKELVDEIVRLSIKHGILTEYTAFLAAETEARTALGFAPAEAGDWAAAPGSLAGGGRAGRSAMEELDRKAIKLRVSAGAVSQEMNKDAQLVIGCVNPTNMLWTADMKQVEVRSICQVSDQTLFNRAGKWVDARILDKEAEAPDRTVCFGTRDFDKLLDKLIAENRQGMLAMGGDVYMLVDNERVLVTWPETETK